MAEKLENYDDEELQDNKFAGIHIPYFSSRFKKHSTFIEYQKCTESKNWHYLVLINTLNILKSCIEIVKTAIESEVSDEKRSFITFKNYFILQLGAAILVNLFFIAVAKFNFRKVKINTLACLTWILIFSQGWAGVLQTDSPWTAMSSFLNACFIISLSYAFLPLPLKVLLLLSSIASIVHTVCATLIYSYEVKIATTQSTARNVAADITFIIGLNLSGFYIRFLSDRVDQKAFFETRRFVTVLDKLKKFAEKQKTLLLSVIPNFIAKDLFENLSDSSSFDSNSDDCDTEDEDLNKSKLYHFRDVSILFTDVMGFTELASKCSPEKLVEILNELFETFDYLAASNNCLRIKLLGDCYYCICGLPLPRSDHAISSVNLGFQMIQAIRQVREDHKVNLDMRIGIHSGAVLCGIVGKIKWQFDIWSHDVKTANHMESSGVPGRVHISESTLKYLNDLYKVEVVKDVQNDFLIKQHLKTYLIVEENSESGAKNELVNLQFQEEENNPKTQNNYVYRRRPALGSKVVAQDVQKFYRLSMNFKDKSLRLKYTSGDEDEAFISHLFCAILLWACAEISFQILAQFGWQRTLLYVFCKIFVLGFLFVLHLIGRCQIMTNYSHRNIFIVTILLTMVVSDFSGIDLGKRFIQSSIFFILAVDCFSQLKMSLKALLILIVPGLIAFLMLNPFNWTFSNAELTWTEKEEFCVYILCYIAIFLYHFHLIEKTSRFLFFRKKQLEEQIKEVTTIKQQNYQLLANILPEKVASHFLQFESISDYSKDLYAYKWPYVSVLFATIPNFKSCYDTNMTTTTLNVQLLHKTISTFDDLLDQERFAPIEKIKNVGSTYMSCSGLGVTEGEEGEKQLCLLIEFALEMKRALNKNNVETEQDNHLRIGVSYGPVVAGVIGKGKPCFDIWGNTVNEAARMDTTGRKDFIQVPKETAMILQKYNFEVDCQGLTYVKGKGNMETYNVVGKRAVTHADRVRIFGKAGKQSFAEVVFDVVKIQKRQRELLWKKGCKRKIFFCSSQQSFYGESSNRKFWKAGFYKTLNLSKKKF